MASRIEPRVPDVRFEIPLLDDDHEQLAGQVTKLLRAVALQDTAGAQSALAALRRQADDHFAREEALMSEAGYPDSAGHRARHQRLLAELSALRVLLDMSSRLRMPLLPLGYVKRWFRAHTTRDDLRFAAFLDAREERFLLGLA